jgi:hypothetical protein
MCGCWFHNGCGNIKAKMADSGKWSSNRCKWDWLCQLEEKLENILQQIVDLKWKNKGLEEQLRGVAAGCEDGSHDMVWRKQEAAECLVLSDSIIRSMESEHMRVWCFLEIRTEQLQRLMEKKDLGSSDTVINHVGTNYLRRTVSLDYVMGDVYALANKVKTKFPHSRLVLSGILR